jgi:sulfonate transport system ATP-binding protein
MASGIPFGYAIMTLLAEYPRYDDAAAPSGIAIAAYGLAKAFGDKQVLRGLNFNAAAGEFIAVVGRSGCGKSTLLRLLAGLETPDSGRVSFGVSGSGLSGGPREFARVMFQEPRLLPWSNLAGNVAVGLGESGNRVDTRRRTHEMLAAVGLAERAEDWPSVLSGGQKQRVALARALVSRPRFLALDEPLGALDALTRIEMQRFLENVWRREGFTAVLVTHDVAEAITLADRVLLIESGKVAHDIVVDLPRPRHRGSAAFAALEEELLSHLLHNDDGATTLSLPLQPVAG